MNLELSEKSMPEAEVTLRLVFWLFDHIGQPCDAKIAIDGAHVRIKDKCIFRIVRFLKFHSCCPDGEVRDGWKGKHTRNGSCFEIKAGHGFDIQVKVAGSWIKVECKGGPLKPRKGKSPNAILSEAIGQVVGARDVQGSDDLWVAVPDSDSKQFQRVAESIVKSAAFQRTGIKIVLVSRDGGVRMAKLVGSRVEWIDLESSMRF